jgi:hypothetical protein
MPLDLSLRPEQRFPCPPVREESRRATNEEKEAVRNL